MRAENVAPNLAEIVAQKNEVVKQLSRRHRKKRSRDPNFIYSAGRRDSLARIRSVGETQLESEKIFINTGGRAVIPEIPGLDPCRPDERKHHGLNGIPEHMIILGGGYIGLEFGQMFRRLAAASQSFKTKGKSST